MKNLHHPRYRCCTLGRGDEGYKGNNVHSSFLSCRQGYLTSFERTNQVHQGKPRLNVEIVEISHDWKSDPSFPIDILFKPSKKSVSG